MSVYSPQYHAMVFSPGPARSESVTSVAAKPADTGVKDEEGFNLIGGFGGMEY